MREMNVFMGNLTKDPEIRDKDGKKMAVFSIAVKSYGDKVEYPDFTAFGNKAEYAEKYLKKGDLVVVKAEYHEREYQDKDGNTRRAKNFVVKEFSPTNTCIFLGNLVKDAEITTTGNGTKVARLQLAANGYKDSVSFPRLVAFNKLAEFFEAYGKKGTRFLVEAEYRDESYENKDGEKRRSHTFYVRSANFASGKKKNGNAVKGRAPSAPEDNFVEIPEGMEEELPFI